MARKTEKIQIGSTQYTITLLGADDGSMLFKKLLSVIGPQLGQMLSTLKAGDDAETLVLGLVLRISGFLPDELFLELREKFKASCHFKTPEMTVALPLSTQGLFDDLFAGEYATFTEWFSTCMKMNFMRSFLDKLNSASLAAE